jgi:hypothetical protein
LRRKKEEEHQERMKRQIAEQNARVQERERIASQKLIEEEQERVK